MKHRETSFVIKYFDLIDGFIKVHSCSDEILSELQQEPATNKSSYRKRVVEICVPEVGKKIRPALEKLDDDYDPEIVEELLYQICIDVNPALEIHQVSLPAPTDLHEQGKETETTLVPRPGSKTSSKLYRKVLGLERALKNQVVGQDLAIQKMVQAVKKSAVGLKRPGSPIGTFLLVGRTGTGKTELAKAVSRTLFDGTGSLVRIDCSEYSLPHEYAKLIGAPPGYIGHTDGGYLTESVKKNPQCVVLFDEIEKAHQKVHNLLLQLLDEGVLTDSKGQTISFTNTIVILTSNLGIEKIDAIRDRMGFSHTQKQSLHEMDDLEAVTLDALKESFRPEFINRIDDVVVFNPLDHKVCAKIANNMLREVSGLLQKSGIQVRYSSSVKNALAHEGYSEEFGARELRRLIKRKIEDPLTELIINHGMDSSAKIQVKVQNGQPVVEILQTKSSTAGKS